MYILYLDESGTHNSRYFIVGGLAVFERETSCMARGLDQLQARRLPGVSDPAQIPCVGVANGERPSPL